MKRNPLTPDQQAALDAFKAKHGRYWKRHLNNAWVNGTDEKEPGGAFLRQIRNTLGPVWLGRY